MTKLPTCLRWRSSSRDVARPPLPGAASDWLRGLGPVCLILVASNLWACVGAVEVPDGEGANLAPAVPRIVSPTPGQNDIPGEALSFHVSPINDPDGSGTGTVEVEVWAVSAAGTQTARIWRGAAPSDRAVTLADGEFDLGLTAFEPWQRYSVRARHIDAGTPPAESDWSPAVGFRTDDGSTALFRGDAMQDIRITIPPESIAALNAQALTPCVQNDREYYRGAVELEGRMFADVGLHTKGGCGSSRTLDGKPSFKIKLDWTAPGAMSCAAERRWRGQKSLTLNNGVQDPTAAHERLGYAFLAKLGAAVPRITSVRVHVNGDYWGVYQLLESPDRRFLDRRFSSPRGMLYEGAYWCDLVTANLPQGDADNMCLRREFKPDACDGSGNDAQTYDDLRRLVRALDGMGNTTFFPSIYEVWDYDVFLNQWAAHTILGHWDAYEFSIINNYRVYHDPGTRKWSMISTGIDQTFGSNMSGWAAQARLAAACLQTPYCERKFATALRNAVATFQAMALDDRAREIYAQIKNDVYADPRKEYSNAAFDAAHAELRQWIAARPAQVLADLAAHGF